MSSPIDLNFQIHSFGCKVNTYDAGLIESRMQKAGFQSSSMARIHVLNTCAVTQEATREAMRLAKRIKAGDPESVVVATGCSAQVDTDLLLEREAIDLVIANSHKAQIAGLVRSFLDGTVRDKLYKSNIFHKEDLEPGGGVESHHTRSFLKIQDGCNSFCTFCVIPFARGKSRSLTLSEIVRRVQELVDDGVKEVVLTGVHIADYEDGDRGLEDLVEAILGQTKLLRLRLTSLEPKEVSERLLELFSDERLCSHFHMSIQSAHTRVLKNMKRKYTAEDVEQNLFRIREVLPNAYIGMDVIAGFPGETVLEFEESLARLKRSPWTRLHVFPYSERPGTWAARQTHEVVSSEEKSARAKQLRDLSNSRWVHEAGRQMGQLKRVLGLRSSKMLARDFWTVEGDFYCEPNRELLVRIVGYSGQSLLGAPA